MKTLIIIICGLLASGVSAAEPDPLLAIPWAKREVLSKYEVPPPQREKLLKRKTELQSLRIGLAPFRHLYAKTTAKAGEGEVDIYAGSGYDYTESVLEGIIKSGLFEPAQIGISNFPPNETWTHVLGAIWLGTSKIRGLRFSLTDAATEKVVFDETCPLPLSWDKIDSGDDRQITVTGETPTKRDIIMSRFGEYLAFKTAEILLEGKP